MSAAPWGHFEARIKFAKSSATFYIGPNVVLEWATDFAAPL
jgi:hypothetical protein